MSDSRKVPCCECGHPADWYHPGPILRTLFVVPFTRRKITIVVYDERDRDDGIFCGECLFDQDQYQRGVSAGRDGGFDAGVDAAHDYYRKHGSL